MTRKKSKDELDGTEVFAKKTYKEVKIWDWLGRILPLTVLAVLTICHYFQLDTIKEYIFNVSLIVFFIFSFVWWYWAIYKIAVSVRYIQLSQYKFKRLMIELNQFKRKFNNIRNTDDSNRQR